MKRVIVLVTLLVLLAGLLLSGIGDTSVSIADTDIPGNKVTSSATEGNNSSASATITVTMPGISSPRE